MEKQSRFYKLLVLFTTFLRIGLFTFGGGYSMIPIIQKEVCEKKKWINDIELLEILAISESTPGPIAVNTSTFVGYKVAGFLGALFSLLGLMTPSFVILLIISTFYEKFLSFDLIYKAFQGLKIAVIVLLFNAFNKLRKIIKVTPIGCALFVLTLLIILADTIFNLKIPSLTLIIIASGLVIGVLMELITSRIKKEGNK